MPEFTCPTCDVDNKLENEDLPDSVYDETEWECQHCGQKLKIGWVAEVEVREVIRD